MERKRVTARPYEAAIEPFSGEDSSRHFFAAVNSGNGFISYFDDIFDREHIDTLYLLGGGPGSGKSTLLKRVAREGLRKGCPVEQIHCSSSPYSLDGVILPDIRTAVIDATPPHTYTPYASGVRELTVDLGRAWDLKKLSTRREDIYTLTDAKKKEYRKAYLYLKAANLLDSEACSLAEPYILWEKMEKNVNSVAAKTIPAGCHYTADIRIQRSAGGAGSIYFDTFSRMAKTVYRICDYRGIGWIYFSALLAQAKRRGAAVMVSYSPETAGRIDGLYFPASGVCFTVYAQTPDKNINCERFADKKAMVNIRQKYQFTLRSRDSLLAEGYEALYRAGVCHDKIEELYHPCTDYGVVEDMTQELCRRIFS